MCVSVSVTNCVRSLEVSEFESLYVNLFSNYWILTWTRIVNRYWQIMIVLIGFHIFSVSDCIYWKFAMSRVSSATLDVTVTHARMMIWFGVLSWTLLIVDWTILQAWTKTGNCDTINGYEDFQHVRIWVNVWSQVYGM